MVLHILFFYFDHSYCHSCKTTPLSALPAIIAHMPLVYPRKKTAYHILLFYTASARLSTVFFIFRITERERRQHGGKISCPHQNDRTVLLP